MIVITFKGAASPLTSKVRGWGVVQDTKAPSVSDAIDNAFTRFRNEPEGFLFVGPGAKINPVRVHSVQNERWDVAAYVDRIGRIPTTARAFDGVGRISLDTIFIKRTPSAVRLLTRWKERNAVLPPGREALNLAITLVEMKDVVFRHLSPEWIWQEWMRASHIGAVPVVEFKNGQKKEKEQDLKISTLLSSAVKPKEEPTTTPPGVLWVGHLYQYTGYGKANREVLFRLANSMSVRIDDSHKEPCYVREELKARLDVHKNVLVAPGAPLLRMMGPDHISKNDRHRIVWTMQETSVRVHDDMVKRANENFDEIWTPSLWNLGVFKNSGIRLPGRVMPLGIDPVVFRTGSREPLPPCRLISTSRRGRKDVPKGFVFLTVGLPGFRKGWDVIADAAQLAFGGRRDVNVVIALTHSPSAWNEKVYRQFANYKIPIWTLEGSFDEYGMARIYRASDAYVSASRGEGFNLPAAEASACGLPVIVPANTCHPEIFGPEAFLFKPDGVKRYPEGDWISDWYKGQLFSRFGKPSIRELAEILETVSRAGQVVYRRATMLREKIRTRYTWDAAAARAAERLLEVQP